jgi:hypothetical protein
MGKINLSLDELRLQGAGRDIFPKSAFFAIWSALPLGSILRRYLAISMGPLQSVPKIVGIPVPCCDPSDVEL